MSSFQQELSLDNEVMKFKSVEELLEDVIYRNPKMSASEIAAALDKSPSELSRMIRPNPDQEYQRRFPLSDLPRLIEATEDNRIIEWLYFKYLVPEETKRRIKLEKLERALPLIESALREIKGIKKGK
jgi:hypothetical protein